MRASSYRIPAPVIAHRLGDAMLLVNLDSSQMYEMNESGARLWTFLAEGKSVEDAATAMLEEFDVSPEKLGQEAEALLDQLISAGLAEPGGAGADSGSRP